MSNAPHSLQRLERLADERDRTQEKLDDMHALAEEEQRPLNESEQALATKYRSSIGDYEEEIIALGSDVERAENATDVSQLVHRVNDPAKRQMAEDGAVVHRTFAQFARDQMIADEKLGRKILPLIGGDQQAVKEAAAERVERTLQTLTSTTVAGLIIPSHMTDIMDIISRDRPVVESGRRVPLDRGSLTYPIIGTRPSVIKQTTEKTEAGTVAPTVSTGTLNAETYLGAVNMSWQAINWSTPDVLSLYFELAAEAYARQTENRACDVLEDAAIGTLATQPTGARLGTVGTESFGAWRSAVSAGVAAIYAATGGRHRTNTLYLSANRFFQLATLGTDQVAQMAPIGQADMSSMSGNFFGMKVVGSYGFDQDVAIVGDSSALLIGENPGNPVEMRVIEPAIGGWEVGLIGAFNAAVFDVNRFQHLGTHL